MCEEEFLPDDRCPVVIIIIGDTDKCQRFPIIAGKDFVWFVFDSVSLIRLLVSVFISICKSGQIADEGLVRKLCGIR